MKVITVAIQKGGTGKTTSAAILAQAAVARGLQVLAVDLDPQGNLGFALGANPAAETGTAYNLLTGRPAAECIHTTAQGLDIIPADRDLAAITSGTGSARRLREALRPVREWYDLIIIDTPPTAGELQYNALMAADGLIIPLQADAYNLQSLYQMADTAQQIQQSNDDLQILGIVFTQYDGRSSISRQMQKTIINSAAKMGVPYLGTIRGAVAVKEAAALQQSLYQYAPKSKPAADYMDVFHYITDNKYLVNTAQDYLKHDAQEV